MPMRVCNLSSGSDGNSTYVETQSARVLFDCGLSCKEIEKRLLCMNVRAESITAIVISHEHSDHIKGIEVFAKKYKTLIYAHEENWKCLEVKFLRINPMQFKIFSDVDFCIGDLNISPVKLPHDAIHCCGFTFWEKTKKISIITDLGHTNSRILEHMKDSKLIFLESNHDEEMLIANPIYSASLKRRILSQVGHLSNIACAKAITEIVGSDTKYIMLSHISTRNNTPILAFNTVRDYLLSQNIDLQKQIILGVTSTSPSNIFNVN